MRPIFILAPILILMGCGSDPNKLERDTTALKETAQAINAKLQWQIDDETAAHIFNEDQYLTFRKCHGTPPATDAHKKQCATLQNAVAQEEARAQKQQSKEKANW